MRAIVLLYASVLVVSLSAQSGSTNDEGKDEQVFTIGGDVSPPRLTHKVDPSHVAGTGTVLLELVVSSNGRPRDLHVIESAGKELDNSAIEAVKQWRFEPARRNDKPVAVRITVEIRFHDV
jgi:protein TonB